MHTPITMLPMMRQALLEARADGLTICTIKFGDGVTCACAIVAYLRSKNITYASDASPISVFSANTGIPHNEVWRLIDGFDGKRKDSIDPWNVLGRELRHEFLLAP